MNLALSRIALLLALLLPGVSGAQEARLSWEPPQAHTGQPATLHIRLPLRRGEGRVVLPERWTPGEADVLERTGEVQGRGDRMRWEGAIRLLPLAPGTLEPEPLRLTIVSHDGSLRRLRLTVPPLPVSGLSAEDAEPLGPSSPRELERFDPRPLLALLGLLLTAAAAWWLWRRLTRRAPDPPPGALPSSPRPPPWSETLRQLSALRASLEEELHAGRGDAWVDRLSDVLRAYLGHRYGVPALERTTEEVLEELASRMPHEACRRLAELLHWADRVKFAGLVPAPQEAREALGEAEAIVGATAPRAAPGGTR